MTDYNARGFTGISKSLLPKHFAQLKSEGYEVDLKHFLEWERRAYERTTHSRRWAYVNRLSLYFHNRYEDGGVTVFNRLFAIHEKRKRGSDSAYNTPKRKKNPAPSMSRILIENSTPSSDGNGDFLAQATALQKRIEKALSETNQRQEGLLNSLSAVEQSIAQIGEGA